MLHTLNRIFPVRYTVFGLASLGLLASLGSWAAWGVGIAAGASIGWIDFPMPQKTHTASRRTAPS